MRRSLQRSPLFPYTTLFRSTPSVIRRSRMRRRRIAATAASCLRSSRRSCAAASRSEEHTSELQSRLHLVCRLLLEKKKKNKKKHTKSEHNRTRTFINKLLST